MKKTIDIILILGFLLVDWLMFHNLFKGGERYTMTEFLTGILSLLVIYKSSRALLKM